MVNAFYKVLLSMDGSIGGLFLLVKGEFASKSRGWPVGKGRWSSSRHFEK
jgi:hypothetical protein